MVRKNNIIIVLFILIFCSCEKQRYLNVPFTDTQIVVNGLFNENGSCEVEISKSQSLNDTSTVKNVSGAKVFLHEENQKIEELVYTPPTLGKVLGSYKSKNANFSKSKNYSINVELGDKTISAKDLIPKYKIAINNFTGSGIVDTTNAFLRFELGLHQSSIEKQFVHIILQQRWVLINSTDSSLTLNPWFSSTAIPDQNPIGFIPTTSEPFSLNIGGALRGIMLDNQNFNGITKQIQFSTKKLDRKWNNAYLESRVIVRSVSENYFKYYFSSSQYFRTKGIPLTEPVIIHNNITNGLGNFSGYTADTSSIIPTYY